MRHRVLALAGCLALAGAAQARTVVLIGGEHREGPGKHDYPAGIEAMRAMLGASPDLSGLEVVAYPDGWPREKDALRAADAIVLYFDGLDRHPLRDAAHRADFEAAMRRGAGVVALHQASTVPVNDDLGLTRWLGGVRRGMFDRATEFTTVVPAPAKSLASGGNAVVRGVGEFSYRDEFYPTIRFANTGGLRFPLLRATLHPQFRDGRWLVEDRSETVDVAWAFERQGHGRAVVYTGAHYAEAFAQPGVRRFLANAVLWTAGGEIDADGVDIADVAPVSVEREVRPSSITRATFHIDAARSGWRANETVLSPANVAADTFGQLWQSPALDAFEGHPPRLYAMPLFVDNVRLKDGPQRGEAFDTVFAASSNGFVYAINAAQNGDIAPGRILWRTSLGAPCLLQPAPLDGVATGILSTPVIDVRAGRMYVTHCDPVNRWKAYALDIATGAVLPGWPVRLDEGTFNRLNRNAGPEPVPPKRRFDFRVQRGALNLSPDGTQLHIVFGESETGWLAAVDTRTAKVSSAFAAVAMPHRGSGGIWGAGGPALDAEGHVYVVTGSGFDGYQDAVGDWAQSVLKLSLDAAGYTLRGTYSPFNHCLTAKHDIDLGSGGATLLPGSALMAVGGKQGNVYLLDRARLPGPLDRRTACSDDASRDASLLAPQPQPQFGTRGPLNVFGPYSEEDAALDLARARSVPAAFRDAGGALHLFVTGNSKQAPGSAVSVPPSLVKLRVVESDAPHLRIERRNETLALGNPGSPVVTSRGGEDALVWVLDENAPRSALLSGARAPRPVLYAFDARTLEVRWRSAPGELQASGKYNEPGFGRGLVFVGTDRVQAFGLGDSFIAVPREDASPSVEAGSADAAAAQDVAGLDAAGIYERRCAMCHDHAQGNIPPRAVLATRPRERIVQALAHGAMQVQARGLTAKQIEDIADFLHE